MTEQLFKWDILFTDKKLLDKIKLSIMQFEEDENYLFAKRSIKRQIMSVIKYKALYDKKNFKIDFNYSHECYFVKDNRTFTLLNDLLSMTIHYIKCHYILDIETSQENKIKYEKLPDLLINVFIIISQRHDNMNIYNYCYYLYTQIMKNTKSFSINKKNKLMHGLCESLDLYCRTTLLNYASTAPKNKIKNKKKLKIFIRDFNKTQEKLHIHYDSVIHNKLYPINNVTNNLIKIIPRNYFTRYIEYENSNTKLYDKVLKKSYSDTSIGLHPKTLKMLYVPDMMY